MRKLDRADQISMLALWGIVELWAVILLPLSIRGIYMHLEVGYVMALLTALLVLSLGTPVLLAITGIWKVGEEDEPTVINPKGFNENSPLWGKYPATEINAVIFTPVSEPAKTGIPEVDAQNENEECVKQFGG